MNDLNKNKPKLSWISVDLLNVDKTYQRDVGSLASQKNIKYLTEKFSWARFGALIVVKMNKDHYMVIDGQHRLQAAIGNDIKEVPCTVVENNQLTQQAKDFVGVNINRVNLNPLAKFHAMIVAGDEDAIALKEICDEANIDIPRYPVARGQTAPRQTQAVGTLLRLLGTNSRRQIIWALTIIPEAYPEERGQIRASFIKSLCHISKTYPKINRERMVDVLLDVDPADLETSARGYIEIHGGSTVNAIHAALIRLYNNRSTAKEKLQ